SASHPHHFLGVTKSGLAAITVTRGNPLCHIILRGGNSGPNFEATWVAKISDQMAGAKIADNIMIDCSHGNSRKNHRNQPNVSSDVAKQVAAGNKSIVGVMIESNISEGRQDIPAEAEGGAKALKYGQSITDACVSWEQTIPMLQELAQAVRDRRAKSS
ncbi:3-deoxy-7-phosphoheptulonate synthase, partial [Coemansia sp. RSA 2049]